MRFPGLLFVCVVVFSFLSSPVPAEGLAARESTATRPVVGLVLSGGGARGLAHVGVLKALEEMHVPVDIVVGTSAGSAIGGLYAMGLDVSEIEDRFHRMNWQLGLKDQRDRASLSLRRKRETMTHSTEARLGFDANGIVLSSGLLQGQQLQFILNGLFAEAEHVTDFDRLPRRYRAVAADLATGEEVVIASGQLAQAVRASMSIPGVFSPVTWKGRLLVDGGIANNLPVSVARALGADVIIAVDISEPLTPQDQLTDIVSIGGQMTNFLTRRNVSKQLQLLTDRDVLIVPDLEDVTSADFFRSDEIVEMGATATRNQALQLVPYRLSDQEWRDYRHRIHMPEAIEWIIDDIRVRGTKRFSNQMILDHVSQRPGKLLNRQRLERDLDRIYGLGYFESVSYTLLRENGRKVLQIEVSEKQSGTNYLLFDFGYEEDFDLDRRIRLGVSANFTGVNRYGAESQTYLAIGTEPELRTEFYQPLKRRLGYYVMARALVKRQQFNYFNEGELQTEADIIFVDGELVMGKSFANQAEIYGGFKAADNDIEGRIGTLAGNKISIAHGGYVAGARYDTLNDRDLPDEGAYADVFYEMDVPFLGADQAFRRLNWEAKYSFSHEAWVVHVASRGQQVLGGQLLMDKSRTLGGESNLSAYPRDWLAGQNAQYGAFSLYRKVQGGWREYFIGGAIEAGRVGKPFSETTSTRWHPAWSLIAGTKTVLGTVKVTLSYGDAGEGAVYLSIGQAVR